MPGIKLLPIVDGIKQNYAYYPILVDKSKFGLNRDELANKLKEQGVFARKYFYPLVSENKEFKNDMTVNTPNALEISHRILCLPLYAHLDVEDVDRICEIILEK